MVKKITVMSMCTAVEAPDNCLQFNSIITNRQFDKKN